MRRRSLFLLVTLMSFGWVSAQQRPAKQPDQIMRDFQLPNYNDDGVMTSQLFGETARIKGSGGVDIERMRLEVYDPKQGAPSTPRIVVTSPRCQYDQNEGRARSDDPVRVQTTNMTMTGSGYRWDSKSKIITVYGKTDQVHVIIFNRKEAVR